MASSTPRLSLYQPADDGSEPLNVATDINDNLEKIDAAVGFVPATESTPPSNVYSGMGRFNTDTDRLSFWKPLTSQWVQILSAGVQFLGNITLGAAYRIGIGMTNPGAIFDVAVTSITATNLMRFRQSNESFSRVELASDGLSLGKGTSAPDVRIYRPADNQIALQGSVSMNSGLSVTGVTAVDDLNVSGDLTVDGVVSGDLDIDGDLNVTGIGKSDVRIRLTDLGRTSATLAADTTFDYPLEANSTYLVEMFCMVGGDPSGDFKTTWTVPSGSTGPRYALAAASAITTVSSASMITVVVNFGAAITSGLQATTTYAGHQELLVITTAGTAGTLQFNWAQGSTTATATTLKAGSIMRVKKVA